MNDFNDSLALSSALNRATNLTMCQTTLHKSL